MNVNIGTARITGLAKPIDYNRHRRCYVMAITFEDTSTLFFNHIPNITLGQSEGEAKFKHAQILRNFEKANIRDGEKVVVAFRDDGDVVAIGKVAQNVWIDCLYDFHPRTFGGLHLNVSGLTVY